MIVHNDNDVACVLRTRGMSIKFGVAYLHEIIDFRDVFPFLRHPVPPCPALTTSLVQRHRLNLHAILTKSWRDDLSLIPSPSPTPSRSPSSASASTNPPHLSARNPASPRSNTATATSTRLSPTATRRRSARASRRRACPARTSGPQRTTTFLRPWASSEEVKSRSESRGLVGEAHVIHSERNLIT